MKDNMSRAMKMKKEDRDLTQSDNKGPYTNNNNNKTLIITKHFYDIVRKPDLGRLGGVTAVIKLL